LGRIRISDGSVHSEVEFFKPDGVVMGAMKGAGYGLVGSLETLQMGPAIVLFAPAYMVYGIARGAKDVQKSPPETKVKEFEKTFRATIQNLNVPETLRKSIADRIHDLKASEVTGPSDQAASVIMEVVVKRIEFSQEYFYGPHSLFITESTRLIRAADGMELYSHTITATGMELPFDNWLSEDAEKLVRQEVERNCHKLAVRIVDEIFYRPEEKKNKPKRTFDEPGNH
jgi:hypothetical protein